MRKQFTFYRSYLDATAKLSQRRRWKYLEAVIRYGLDGQMPEGLEPVEEALFMLTKPTLDTGRMLAQGGSAKKGSGNKASGNLSKSSREAPAKEKEIEIEKEIEKEIEVEIETEIEKDKERSRALEKEGESQAEPGALQRRARARENSAFEDFWKQYPVQIGKREALRVWQNLNVPAETVLKGLRAWKQSIQWQEDGGRFVPMAEKFLLQRWFEQEPASVPMGASGELGQAEIEAIEMMMRRTD